MVVVMRQFGRALVLSALALAGCLHDGLDITDGVGGSGAGDLAMPLDGAGPPTSGAGLSTGDLGVGSDMLPPPERLALCPRDQATDIGTNSLVRVHAATAIDARTVSASSLVVRRAGRPVSGAVTAEEA